jgi:hypothetical protein
MHDEPQYREESESRPKRRCASAIEARSSLPSASRYLFGIARRNRYEKLRSGFKPIRLSRHASQRGRGAVAEREGHPPRCLQQRKAQCSAAEEASRRLSMDRIVRQTQVAPGR